MSEAILPELFALLGIDMFLLLSLLTCLLEEKFPKATPYIYQIAALAGYGHLLVSKEFLTMFSESMRFWYSFFYLIVALANIMAINVYIGVSKKLWTLAKAWSGAVSFPTIAISVFFAANYSYTRGTRFPMLLLQIGLVASLFVMGLSLGALLLRSDLLNKLRGRGENREWNGKK